MQPHLHGAFRPELRIEGALGAVELRVLGTELRLQLARRDLVRLEQMALLLGVRGEGGVAGRRGVPGGAGGVLEEPALGVGQPGELGNDGGVRGLNGLRVIGELRELQLRVGRLDGRDAGEQIGEEGVRGGGNRRGGMRRRLLLLLWCPGGLLLRGVAEEGVEGVGRGEVPGELEFAERRHGGRGGGGGGGVHGAVVVVPGDGRRRIRRLLGPGPRRRGVGALPAEQLGEGARQVGRLLLLVVAVAVVVAVVVRRRAGCRHLRLHCCSAPAPLQLPLPSLWLASVRPLAAAVSA
uniref:Predicted protein n=1 Tax=Hordeum vulgare subsp. vulgare TaxID=112509 RepID=F2D2I0_HORVV|nr:predicted protein [Hordeum vulgare subsp. vulgare]